MALAAGRTRRSTTHPPLSCGRRRYLLRQWPDSRGCRQHSCDHRPSSPARGGKVLTMTPAKSTSLLSSACSGPNYFLKTAASAEGSNEFRSSRERGFLSATVSNDTKRLLSLGQLASIARQ